jgi:colanic acid/amylovoran biosynthesis glycosyltransferase
MSSVNPVATQGPGADPAVGAISVAYLTSQYPMLSMSFLLREVIALRALGLHIDAASINVTDRPLDRMTAEEATEARNAYHLKGHGSSGAILAHVKTLLTNPGGYCRGIGMAAGFGGVDLKRLFYHLMYFTQALMVGVWMQDKRLRHLHVHLGSQAATVGMYVKRIHGFGFSITVHGPDEFWDTQGQILTEKVAAADFICCISYFCRSQLMRLSPYAHWNKLLVARLGVDTEVFRPKPFVAAPETFVILSVGRLVPAKGQHQLLDAVDRLAQQGRRVRLHLVGTGPDEASLRERVSIFKDPGVVVFEGPVNQDRIRELYGKADVFCIPSFAEGIPVVLMEAMAMEIPCVTTQIAGIPELIRSEVDGLLVAASDMDGLTEALARMMDDGAMRERMGKSSRARVVEQYNLQRNMEALAAIFRERVRSGLA